MITTEYTWDQAEAVATHLATKIGSYKPVVGIVCGSGLGCLPDEVDNPVTIDYSDIPSFPAASVVGHAGCLVVGELGGKHVICLKGRFHPYEGHHLSVCVFPIRVFKCLGVKTLIVSNAAGGLRSDMAVGDVMVLKDQINLLGFANVSPFCGPNDESRGPRFFGMNSAYTRELQKKMLQALDRQNIKHTTGVYASVGGPAYETVAECIALQRLGADAVGMSTTQEVLAAVHCGMSVAGFSVITNVAITDWDDESQPNHEEVIEASRKLEKPLARFMSNFIKSF